MEGLEAALQSATREELVAEIVKLTAQVERLEALVAELQGRLNKPPKNPGNSSVAPSRGEKENKKPGGGGKRRKRGFGAWRRISENPDEIVDVKVDRCAHCQADLSGEKQVPHSVREKIDLAMKTHVAHARLHSCECPRCGNCSVAEAPEGFEGSPFGRSVDAVVLLLHYTQAVSYKRLKELMSEVFGLEISQGAIRNIIKRSQRKFERRAEEIAEAVRGSPVICSDETGSRVGGAKWWEWVFVSTDAVLHVLRPSRAKKVIEEVMEQYEPNVWVSDLYGAQLGHARKHQLCLAHQIRDLKYAVECGDTVFAPDMRALLCEAMDMGKERGTLDDATLEKHLGDLERKVDELLDREPAQEDALRLKNRYLKHRNALFVFLTNRDVPYTNNVSERSIRMSKMFLKVTNGFRSVWGADMFGAVRSVINTGKIQGLSPYESILATLEERSITNPA